MIYRLRRKFVAITAVCTGLVFALIFCGICYSARMQLSGSMDMLTDVIAAGGGGFPASENAAAGDVPERPFAAVFFTVRTDKSGRAVSINTDNNAHVSEEEAAELAEEAMNEGEERGWISDYRYRVTETEAGKLIVFVNGETNRHMTTKLLEAVFFVLAGSFCLIILLIVIFSKKAAGPAAESYEKQKQFVTDAGHELKTPLTLILSNVDIVEAESGKSEWLDDIRSEGERMGALINRLITLSKMDEGGGGISMEEFSLSETAGEAVSEFSLLAEEKGKRIETDIEPSVTCRGDEELIRRLIYILLDNAVKYGDEGGTVRASVFRKGRRPVLTVENPYPYEEGEDLEKFFDRFYRADKARTFDGGFGIGLSIAKAIAENHGGDVTVYRKDLSDIGFKVTLR